MRHWKKMVGYWKHFLCVLKEMVFTQRCFKYYRNYQNSIVLVCLHSYKEILKVNFIMWNINVKTIIISHFLSLSVAFYAVNNCWYIDLLFYFIVHYQTLYL